MSQGDGSGSVKSKKELEAKLFNWCLSRKLNLAGPTMKRKGGLCGECKQRKLKKESGGKNRRAGRIRGILNFKAKKRSKPVLGTIPTRKTWQKNM